MTAELDLLTGRQLVTALAQLGVGRWSPDAVRQWIREEPPCPIAEAADQGKPHRYSLAAVLAWLRARTLAERAKGYTRGDGSDLVARIDQALALRPSVPDQAVPPDAPQKIAAITAAPSGEGAPPASGAAPEVSRAKEHVDWFALSDADALLQVLSGRDPRNWKAAEEARTIRRKHLEAMRQLVPVVELEDALNEQVEHIRRAVQSAAPALKLALRDWIRPEMLAAADLAIDAGFNDLLTRLADTGDLDQAGGAA